MPHNANLYAILETAFERAGDATAFDIPGDKAISYRELVTSVARTANALEALGVGPGERVMAQVDKSIENVYLYLATLKCGAIFNPLNTAYTPAELSYFLENARPKLFVGPAERCASIEDAARRNDVRALETMQANGSGTFATLAAQMSEEHTTAHAEPDDVASLLYTSGTTGRSKGAMITHANLSTNAQVLHAYWGFEPGDVLLHTLPTYHVHGLFVALNTSFLNGSRMLWLSHFDTNAALAILPQATVMMGVPTYYTRLLSNPVFSDEHCRNIRLFVSGSAPLLAETHKEFEARTGHRILERYGMTEAGMITSNPYSGGERIAGTVGYALPNISLRVTDEKGQQLPQGEVGVLEIKGPNVFAGYWRMPDKTAEEFRDDGYFITGDIATLAEDGRVTIVGRAKDLIISGGLNIYPKEIEQVIDDFNGVTESAVIGVPHPDFGESVIAVIVCESNIALAEDELIAALRHRLAGFKVPKRVFYVDNLPRNTMGKVQKSALRSKFEDTFSL